MEMATLVSALPRTNEFLYPNGLTKSSLSLSQTSLRRKPIPVTWGFRRFPPPVQALPCIPSSEWAVGLGLGLHW